MVPAERMLTDLYECEVACINCDHPDFLGAKGAIREVMDERQASKKESEDTESRHGRSHSHSHSPAPPTGRNRLYPSLVRPILICTSRAIFPFQILSLFMCAIFSAASTLTLPAPAAIRETSPPTSTLLTTNWERCQSPSHSLQLVPCLGDIEPTKSWCVGYIVLHGTACAPSAYPMTSAYFLADVLVRSLFKYIILFSKIKVSNAYYTFF